MRQENRFREISLSGSRNERISRKQSFLDSPSQAVGVSAFDHSYRLYSYVRSVLRPAESRNIDLSISEIEFPNAVHGVEGDRLRLTFGPEKSLPKQLRHRLRLHQLPRLIQVIHHNRIRLNPERMVNRG
jgi:hypothetical protein